MSKENVISKKEPFARMVKRDHISVGKAWAIRLIAVALSLVVAALVIVAVTKQNPIEVYLGIIDGAVGSNRRIWVTIREMMVLLCIAIGLTPAFKMKFWNIGSGNDDLLWRKNAKLVITDRDFCCQWSGRTDLGCDPCHF